jgi:hypothetical protein
MSRGRLVGTPRDEDEAAPDEDYVIGGTGVVKALGVCLGNLDQHGNKGRLDPDSDITGRFQQILRHVARPLGRNTSRLAASGRCGTISEELHDDEDEAAPDEDYVIGGTGVVKALGVCLGFFDMSRGRLVGTPRDLRRRGVVVPLAGKDCSPRISRCSYQAASRHVEESAGICP